MTDLTGWCERSEHEKCRGELRSSTGWHWWCACHCHPEPSRRSSGEIKAYEMWAKARAEEPQP